MKSILLTGGHVIDPANKRSEVCDVLLEDGKVAKVGKKIDAKGADVIDCKGMLVTPGLFDMHVHFREPGREDKETIEAGLKAALMGGVTSVLTMPNTTPQADNQTVIEYQLSKARKLNLANLFAAGRITKGDKQLAEMWELKNTGAIAVSNDCEDTDDECLLLHGLEWAKTFDLPLISHPELHSLSHDGVMHEGPLSWELGLEGIPRSGEVLAIHRSIVLAEEAGAQLHITHLSTAPSVDAIRQAKKRGVNVTADVSVQHASLTYEECRNYNTYAKMYPPLREESDVKAVQEGLKDGTIDALATDHAPHLTSEKLLPFKLAPKGTVGLETSFAVVNTYLVKKGILTMEEAIRKMATNPPKILKQAKGTLSEGADADVSVFDPNMTWTVDPSTFQSKARNSVFAGKKLTGKAVHVFVGGVSKVRDGKLV